MFLDNTASSNDFPLYFFYMQVYKDRLLITNVHVKSTFTSAFFLTSFEPWSLIIAVKHDKQAQVKSLGERSIQATVICSIKN
jgi:hypothetical protein